MNKLPYIEYFSSKATNFFWYLT